MNRLGFGILSKPAGTAMFWLHLLIYSSRRDSWAVFFRSNIVLNRWKRSIRVCRNQRANQSSFFTLTINEHTITNVCLNLSFLLKIIYIMIKYIFLINFQKQYQLKSVYWSRNLTLPKLALSRSDLTSHSSGMNFSVCKTALSMKNAGFSTRQRLNVTQWNRSFLKGIYILAVINDYWVRSMLEGIV